MKNKKGFELAKTTLRIIMSILALLILLYMGYYVYAGVMGGQIEKKARTELEKIENQINLVKDTETTEAIVDIYPPEGLFLKSDEVGEIDDADCKNMKSCLCFCDDFECNELKVCNGYDFIVEVDGDYSYTLPIGYMVPAAQIDVENVIEFKKAIVELKVYEDKSIIKIKKVAE